MYRRPAVCEKGCWCRCGITSPLLIKIILYEQRQTGIGEREGRMSSRADEGGAEDAENTPGPLAQDSISQYARKLDAWAAATYMRQLARCAASPSSSGGRPTARWGQT